jgi:hypothetical protein
MLLLNYYHREPTISNPMFKFRYLLHMNHNKAIKWLLAGDPSVRYQTFRDLLKESATKIEQEQRSIAEKGWGQKLLNRQQKNGMWGGGLYSPKWISTHYTLLTLKLLGLHPESQQAVRAAQLLLDKGYYRDGGINFFASMKNSETCVTGMVLSMVSWFRLSDDRIHDLARHLLGQQMEDGGWNCNSYLGHTHSSFHTTMSVLEGLEDYNQYVNDTSNDIVEARKKAHEFLLQHHLFRSHRTGEVIDQRMTRFSFPPRWRYDIMRALDYFAAIHHPHDPRFCDAIQILKKKEKDGKWPTQSHHTGREYFILEQAGKPGRINTLRALRILNWWKEKAAAGNCS